MTEMQPLPAPELRTVLEGLLASAAATGASAPPWLAVDDGTPYWIRTSLCRPPFERARAVAVVRDELGLSRAARLGFGGAVVLPASTPAMAAACRAAAEAPAVVSVGECAAAPSLLLDLPGPHLLLMCASSGLWRRQLGLRRMGRRLAEAAATLEVAAARLPGPALLLAGPGLAEVAERLDTSLFRTIQLEVPIDDLSLLARLVEALAQERAAVGVQREPVFELPGGRRVGWWSAAPAEPPGGREWVAWPEAEVPIGHAWRVRWPDGSERVLEDALPGAEPTGSEVAVRLPGWLTEDLRRGSPAGVLVELAARRAARLDLPLWVPQVEPPGLQLLLRLGARVWVDGPAAPES